MLTRLTAIASGIIVCAALAVVLSPTAALADCEVIDGVVYCDASDADQQPGSGRSGNGGNGGNTGPNNGCENQGGGIPGQGCTEGAPAQIVQVPSIDLAWDARGSLEPPAPRMHWSPDPRTYIDPMRTRLWVEPAGFASLQTDPPVEAGGQTVTAYATPKQVVWDLVEKTIRCPTAGGPNSTQCSYNFKRSSAGQPGGKYQITATVVWGVTWDCTGSNCDPGAGGQLDDISMSSTALLPVDEIQTESQPG